MEIQIDHDSVISGVKELEAIGSAATRVAEKARLNSLNASFSGVSGLDQLGGNHGGVINGGPGSAIAVMQSYAEQVEWLSGALAASYQALTGQNAFVARGMDIADEGGAVGEDGVSFPPRPRPRFDSFTFVPPVVTPALSINQLNMDFSATRIGELVQASQMWHRMSADVSSIAGELQAVASDLGSRNRGDVIEAAIGKVAEVARAGETFAANSTVMAQSVERVNVVQQQGALTVAMAMPAINAILDPVARAAAEQSFLMSFPASYTPAVATGVPPIRNLMVMDPAPDGGGEVALGMGHVEGTGSKHNATGLRAPGAPLEALTSLQRAMGAGDFGTVQAGVDDLAGVNGAPLDSVVRGADVGTTAASTGTLTAPPGIGAPGLVPSGAGAGGAGVSLPGPMGGPIATGGPLGGLGQSPTSTAGAGRTPLPGGMQATGGVGPVGSAAAAGRPGVGRLSGGAQAAAGLPNGVAGTRLPGGAPAAGMATGAVGTAASKSGGGMAPRGMMPMMGAPMAGQAQGKQSKVKSVTSAVEEETNVAALLGERPAVVPGVIGAWARG